MRRFYLLLSGLGLALSLAAATLPVQVASGVDVVHNICTGTNTAGTNAGGTDVCRERDQIYENPVTKAIRLTVNITAVIVGIAAVIALILGGLKMVSANGNAQDVATARSTMIYALIGLVIAALAPVIVAFVIGRV